MRDSFLHGFTVVHSVFKDWSEFHSLRPNHRPDEISLSEVAFA